MQERHDSEFDTIILKFGLLSFFVSFVCFVV
jgi:hypothetical protein